jgi:rod shape-determining protein MreC
VTVRRVPPSPLGSRGTGALRRRLIVGLLVVLALVLISLSFRSGSDGSLGGIQSTGATVLRPFAVGVERVAQPFRDAYSWFDSLFTARSDAETLRTEVEELRQRAIQNEFALQENVTLRRLLEYRDGPRFPRDFRGLAAEVIARPAGAFTQAVVVAVGSDDGVRVNDPVVAPQGLVGLVTRVTPGTARIQLLTDQQLAVPSIDLRTGAPGIVRHARGTRETLVLDRVQKEEVVKVGDELVTAGWSASGLSSLYPKGIPVGEVTSVGQTDTDLYQQVQVDPYVDFGALDAVLVLVPTIRPR